MLSKIHKAVKSLIHILIICCVVYNVILNIFLIDVTMNIYSYLTNTLKRDTESFKLLKSKYNQMCIKYVTVTAYSLSKNECDDDETIGALNTKIIPGFHCAVSRDLIYLLNKKIYLESIGIFKVKDVMNKRFSNKIDICLNDKHSCLNFGIKENIKLVLLD